MIPAQVPARRRAARAARWLTATALSGAAALSGTIMATGAARAASGPAPIPVNTANWSGSAGFGSRAPAWYTDRSGVVHLQGAATQTSTAGTDPTLIGTLPPAARPASTVYTVVSTGELGYADLAIGSNGLIGIIDPRPLMVKDYSFVSLESISYRR